MDILDKNQTKISNYWLPLVALMTLKVTAETNNSFIIQLENLVELLGNTLRPDISVEMTFFQLSFFEIGRNFEWFWLIWGIYGKFAKKMVDSSLLILSLFTSLYSNKNESCWDFTFGYWKTKDTERL